MKEIRKSLVAKNNPNNQNNKCYKEVVVLADIVVVNVCVNFDIGINYFKKGKDDNWSIK